LISSIRQESKSTILGIVQSLKSTIATLLAALKEKSLAKLLSLLYDGSSLEDLVDGVVVVACWVLLLLPVILVPIYYLAVTLMK